MGEDTEVLNKACVTQLRMTKPRGLSHLEELAQGNYSVFGLPLLHFGLHLANRHGVMTEGLVLLGLGLVGAPITKCSTEEVHLSFNIQ